ncbi:MAG: hypothetical protein Q9195_007889 [Heterodermia aff. obscurata]
MQEEPFPPAKGDAPPRFQDVVAQPTSFKFSLKCPRHGEVASFYTLTRLTKDTDTVRFMESLTGWTLKYMGQVSARLITERIFTSRHRRLQKLVLSGSKGLMKSKETHDKPVLYLWTKTPGLVTQLTIRLHDDEKDRWLTSSLLRDSEDTRLTHISKHIELNGLTFQRGPVLDHQHMKAVHYRAADVVELKRGARRLALTFEDNDGVTTHYIKPKDPPGFTLTIDIADSGPFFIPERVYLVSITTVYTLALDGWEHVIPSGSPLLFVEQYGVQFASGSMVPSELERQLQVKYLVLAMLHLMAQMGKVRMWRRAVAAGLLFNKPVGFVKLGVAPAAAGTARDEEIKKKKKKRGKAIDPSSHGGADTPLRTPLGTSKKRLLDPKDRDFVIEYEVKEQRFSCVDLLSTALYAIATAAQGAEDDYCRDLGGWNEERSAVYRIHGLSPDTLTYGLVRRGLSLLPARLYDERNCGREVAWRFLYRDGCIGYGSISASDLSDGEES